MLEIATIVLFVAWLLGVLSGYTWGGGIHLLLLAAGVAIVWRIFQDRRSK